jgi:agmatinase
MSSTNFDFSAVGISNGNFFGFPYTIAESSIVLLPVPWDVTTSYGGGASKGPKAILDASVQLDFYDFDVPDAAYIGVGTIPINKNWQQLSQHFRAKAKLIIDCLESGNELSEELKGFQGEINEACIDLNKQVYKQTKQLLAQNKLVGLVGGDHSTPLGFMRAISEKHEQVGILQIDAHADLRKSYEGFDYSHASIMFNALKLPGISTIVQVGVRDLCEDEMEIIKQDKRVVLFDDYTIKQQAFKGVTWHQQCEDIIATLPNNIYISFDIDGLSPELCPNTGTPVPGGLSFNEAIYLVKSISEAGKTIVGFDLNEVSPGNDEWDANVGARLLYKLCNLMHVSQGK